MGHVRDVIGDPDDPYEYQVDSAIDEIYRGPVAAVHQQTSTLEDAVSPSLTATARQLEWLPWAAEMEAVDDMAVEEMVSALRKNRDYGATIGVAGYEITGAELRWCLSNPLRIPKCYKAFRTYQRVSQAAVDRYPAPDHWDGWKGNAWQHCQGIGLYTIMWDSGTARGLGERHENKARKQQSNSRFNRHKTMDLYNNDRGIDFAVQIPKLDDNSIIDKVLKADALAMECKKAAKNQGLYRLWPLPNF